MANRVFQQPQINLSPENEPKFFVSMESFFAFSFWLAEELTDLVAEHELRERQSKLRNVVRKTSQRSQSIVPRTQA